jgi:hypothetical protein
MIAHCLWPNAYARVMNFSRFLIRDFFLLLFISTSFDIPLPDFLFLFLRFDCDQADLEMTLFTSIVRRKLKIPTVNFLKT